MKPVIYYRLEGSLADESERQAMERNFLCITSRLGANRGDLIIARYSALPFYHDLENDLLRVGALMVNSYKQHRYAADLENWVGDLQDVTPETWRELPDVPNDAFPIIVKGETNSKKFLWDTHCFAKDRRSAAEVTCRLMDDGVIADQHIYYRKYIPLKTYMVGLRGLPVTKEFRVFVCNAKVVSAGYYWSNHYEDLSEKPSTEEIPKQFLDDVISRVGMKIPFYAVDVAQKQDGGWIVIELNDGQQSGLSMNDPEVLYKNLKSTLI